MDAKVREFMLQSALCNLRIARDIMAVLLHEAPMDTPERAEAEQVGNVINMTEAKAKLSVVENG